MRSNPASITLAVVLCTVSASLFAQQPASDVPAEVAADGSGETPPMAQGSGELLPQYDPESPPWLELEDALLIPEADLSEDAERSLADERMAVPMVNNRRVARAFGSAAVGIAASERDVVGPLLMLSAGVASVPWGPPPTLTQTHQASEAWLRLDTAVELGLASDPDVVPWSQTQLRGPRVNRAWSESDDGTTTLRRDMVWGNVRAGRNMRIRRGLRLDVSAGAFELRTAWFERTNVATIVNVAVDLPGYTYVSSQGRGDAFHGLLLSRVGFDVGPRFGSQQGPWARFMLGASGATSAGAELGPTATFRTDLQIFTGLDVQAHERLRVLTRLAYDSARDSYRKAQDGAWMAQLAIMTLY